jgi:hypothetical protein
MMQNARGRKASRLSPTRTRPPSAGNLPSNLNANQRGAGSDFWGKVQTAHCHFGCDIGARLACEPRGQVRLEDRGHRPIPRQFRLGAYRPIKALAGFRGIARTRRPVPATFGSAHALVICALPCTKQNRNCLDNDHQVTFFDHLASKRGTADIAGPSYYSSNHRRTSRAHDGGSRLRSEETMT